MKSNKPLLLQRTATTLIDLYGSARKAAARIGIDHVYLYRMSTGEKDNPSEDILNKLGLEKIIGMHKPEIHQRKK